MSGAIVKNTPNIITIIPTMHFSIADAMPRLYDRFLSVSSAGPDQTGAKQSGNLVTEGRDQGTVAFPEADYKFYLDASSQTRAKRRWLQLNNKDTSETYEKILEDIIRRDHRDSTRKTAPLAIPRDAIRIDSTNMHVDQVVETLYRHIKREQRH